MQFAPNTQMADETNYYALHGLNLMHENLEMQPEHYLIEGASRQGIFPEFMAKTGQQDSAVPQSGQQQSMGTSSGHQHELGLRHSHTVMLP